MDHFYPGSWLFFFRLFLRRFHFLFGAPNFFLNLCSTDNKNSIGRWNPFPPWCGCTPSQHQAAECQVGPSGLQPWSSACTRTELGWMRRGCGPVCCPSKQSRRESRPWTAWSCMSFMSPRAFLPAFAICANGSNHMHWFWWGDNICTNLKAVQELTTMMTDHIVDFQF